MHPRIQFLLGILVYAVVVRVLPYTPLQYPWNFSPVTAICLFSGCLIADRRMAYLLPLGAVLISDVGIALISGHVEWAFPVDSTGHLTGGRLLEWGARFSCLAAAILVGSRLQPGKPYLMLRAVGTSLAFEIAFFLITNFAVWAMPPEAPLYPHTAAGLWSCYVAAVPFFGKSLAGTVLFTLMLFSPIGVRTALEASGAEAERNDLALAG